ncbi:hypothetical protein G9C98_007948 [Cotesia typhae]|uniref:C2H2-type domain-containing protein n=1 Tax=Cotesia typhae TaxID=2053667 RepID=A0A8J5QTC2_9HYME|nr:hypothetical protein G9C98_007948 [Cotesia typhae]
MSRYPGAFLSKYRRFSLPVVSSVQRSSKTLKFACPNRDCNRVFKEQRYLRKHMNYHCGKPPRYKCPFCEYRSIWKYGVKSHMEHNHSGQNARIIEMYKLSSKRASYPSASELHKKIPRNTQSDHRHQ